MVLIIDNYDSFTYNLVDYIKTLGAQVKVIRNDEMSAKEAFELNAKAVIVSPGPSSPKNAGISVEFIQKYAGKVPIFGVCLGMQSIGYAFGAKIVLAKEIMHGKLSKITHDKTGVFKGMNSPMEVVRYHSLAVDEDTLPDFLEVKARTQDSQIMALRHKDFHLEGVQFHPESILTYGGKRLLENFLIEANVI